MSKSEKILMAIQLTIAVVGAIISWVCVAKADEIIEHEKDIKTFNRIPSRF